jgi:hypothetical protein
MSGFQHIGVASRAVAATSISKACARSLHAYRQCAEKHGEEHPETVAAWMRFSYMVTLWKDEGGMEAAQ